MDFLNDLKEKQDVHDYLLDMSYYDSLYHQNDFFEDYQRGCQDHFRNAG